LDVRAQKLNQRGYSDSSLAQAGAVGGLEPGYYCGGSEERMKLKIILEVVLIGQDFR
jgi:hypothetical protein